MKIAMLTSGGDCQGLNSALRGVAKSLYCRFGNDVELYGVRDGYRGLIEDDIRKMNRNDFSGILTLGGTILGTSRQPFKSMCLPAEEYGGKTRLEKMLETCKKYKFESRSSLSGRFGQRQRHHCPGLQDRIETCFRVGGKAHNGINIVAACPKPSTTTCIGKFPLYWYRHWEMTFGFPRVFFSSSGGQKIQSTQIQLGTGELVKIAMPAAATSSVWTLHPLHRLLTLTDRTVFIVEVMGHNVRSPSHGRAG